MEVITAVITVRSAVVDLRVDRRGTRPIDELVVPLDGTAGSERAVPVAASIATALGAGIRLLTTRADVGDRSPTQYLEEVAASLAVPVDVEIALDQDPAVAVAAAAETARVGVCMATHARGRLLGALHPNIADSVIAHAQGPVILVGPNCPAEPLGDGPILLAHDGSPEATEMGRHVLDLAAALDRGVEVVSVVSAPSGKPEQQPYPDETRELRTLCDHAAALGVRARHELVFDHRVHDGLVEEIRRVEPALVAMMTHHRDRLERLREGSITMGVVRDVSVPVVVSHAPTS